MPVSLNSAASPRHCVCRCRSRRGLCRCPVRCIFRNRTIMHRGLSPVCRDAITMSSSPNLSTRPNSFARHPFEKATQVAPLIRPRHREEVEGHVKRAREDGGRSLPAASGLPGDDYADGTYSGRIFAGLASDATLCRDEVFGPVLTVLPLQRGRGCQRKQRQYLRLGVWNLYAGFFPPGLAGRPAIDAGTVWINTYKQFSISTPFGEF